MIFLRLSCLLAWGAASTLVAAQTLEFERNDQAGTLAIECDGRELLTYQYADDLDFPHLWPLRSPSGKLLTEQHPPLDKYPHHRSFWVVDKIGFEDRPAVDFYHSWKNQDHPHDPNSPFNHRIKHVDFGQLEVKDGQAIVETKSRWELNRQTPVLDESCRLTLKPLAEGEYLFDYDFELKASYGDVHFASDAVHYAWPYVRMHPQFSGDQGGTITNDLADVGEKPVTEHVAKWVDYSNTVDGVTEGMAIFSHPSNGEHHWLARAYGTWGPRRRDELSGKPFTLKQGETLKGRVGVYVHRGDAANGKVAERFQEYLNESGER